MKRPASSQQHNIYCRSWCPQNPEVNKVVFALVDELVNAFEATAFHAGMDEVSSLPRNTVRAARRGTRRSSLPKRSTISTATS